MKNKTHANRSKTAENIAAVPKSVEESACLSIYRRSLELGIPQTSFYRIFHKDKGLKTYKVQLTQELKSADHQLRRGFAD